MSSNDRQIPKEIIERQSRELADMLSELIEKAESLKRRLSGEFEQGFSSNVTRLSDARSILVD
jgi:hypothetical protein